MNTKVKPEQILDKVIQLAYADISCYELMSFGNEAYASIAGNDANVLNGWFKERMQQIRDQQIRPLFNDELLAEEKKAMFSDAKANLASSLKDYLATGKLFSNDSK